MEMVLIECGKGRPMMFTGPTERAAKNKIAKWINKIAKEQEGMDAPAGFKIDMKLSDNQFDKALDRSFGCLGWSYVQFDRWYS